MANIERYKLYRQVQVDLHTKILDACVPVAKYLQCANILGILNNQNQVIIESDAEKDALYDFSIYEKIRDGRNAISLFTENYSSKNELENQLLAAMMQTEASLYEIQYIDKKEGMLIVNDVLRGQSSPSKLIDLGLSDSIQRNALIFTRILQLEEFSITSGLGFVFSGDHKEYLLTRSRKMLKKMKSDSISPGRFIAFFHLNRSDGKPILMEKVT